MRLFPSSAGPSRGLGVSRATSSLCSLLLLAIFPSLSLADKAAGDYFVRSLPGAPAEPRLKMHAGHIEVSPEHNGNLFFWHFQNRHIANKQRTVIWINGGPGCSSEDGAMMEIGPYRVKDAKNPVLEYNDGSWNEFANVMFVDNPVGTGFSYVNSDSYVKELSEMADQFVVFLEKWFALFPEYENDDLYIAGESYAGQHIPYISRAILDRNKKTKYPWQIKGLLIGNGWISPAEQYKSYIPFAYEKGLVKRDSPIAKRLEAKQAECVTLLEAEGGKDKVDHGKCEAILQSMLRETMKKVSSTTYDCYNMYDVRLKDSFPSCGMNWPPDLKAVTAYLQRQDVTEALHVSPGKTVGWTECNGAVGRAFNSQQSKPSITLLPDLLKEIDILLFSGAEDLICNHIGTEEMINNMEWNGGKGFELTHGTWAPRREWIFEGESAGFYQEARNLTYVLFHNASHMVPVDYPRRSREMLDKFMKVDIASIGGVPTESVIDGEKTPATSVGGHPNSTAAGEAEKAKLDAAKWSAYYKSGEIALVVVAILAVAWGYYIWRERRQRAGYKGLFGGNSSLTLAGAPEGGMGLEGFRNKRSSRDIEAGDFDENELDEFHIETPVEDTEYGQDRYSVGSSSDVEGRPKEKHDEEGHGGKGKQVEQ